MNCRKSVANETDDTINASETDPVKTAQDEQVEKRMQRLNLYFEKENVSHNEIPLDSN